MINAFVARLSIVAMLLVAACDPPDPSWQVVGRDLPGALLSVWGSSETDVYAVGGDVGDGQGPLVLHFDGTTWTRLDSGQIGNLWWVVGFEAGPVYMGGEGGMILRYEAGAFTRMPTPGTDTVFGIWGSSATDVWAVGGASGGASGGFAWRLVNDAWVAAPGFPAGLAATDAIWKMYGRSASDAWMIGTGGTAVRWDGATLTEENTGLGESLFTVHANAERYVAVGGFGTGTILEHDGSGWEDVSPSGAPPFIGVHLPATGGGYAVGQEGAVYARDDASGAWTAMELGVTVEEAFHSVWVDPAGGVWAVGGQVQTSPVVDGIMIYRGERDPGALP